MEGGELADLPVMVDSGYFLADRHYQTMVLDRLHPGDMSTHFHRWPTPLMDENEKKLPYLDLARERGVKFDVEHGAGSFHFRQAEPLVSQGLWPDSISTDLHINSHNGAMIDMVSVMSKFLVMGVPLDEVIRMSTTNPATQIKRPDLGQIAAADSARCIPEHERPRMASNAQGRHAGSIFHSRRVKPCRRAITEPQHPSTSTLPGQSGT